MASADPNAVESIFVALLDIEPSERSAALSRLCDGDLAMQNEVESLLRFHDSPGGGALDRSPLLSMSVGLAAAGASASGDAVIPPQPTAAGFTLTSVLGSGGMGVVYVAEQHRPKRTVALKVIRRFAADGDMLRRFEHEAEALARLQHPGIAQIFEVGVADFGHGPQPFIAMELVPGHDLIRAAREGKYSMRRRLEVMASVCDAVQHAHQRGVIHRDLKPVNILVVEDNLATPVPADGPKSVCPSQPKILDFGVARVTDADVQVTMARTGVGQLIGTLPYMSPEQVLGEPRDIDTRCDVYALGVILYELLAGRLPHDVSSRSIPEAARIIREESPARLSALNPVFRGDIDTIVSKAMEKDPARRYQSAAELGADIRRFLNDEPIVARRASAFYQIRKFAERNKRLVAAVSIGMMLVLGTAIVSVIFGLQATIERRNAIAAQSAAESRGRLAVAEADKARWSAYLANIAAAQSSLRDNDLFAASLRLAAVEAPRRTTFEWRHLHSRLDDSVAFISRPGPFTAVAIAPDGRTMATAGPNGNIFLWKVDSRDAYLSLAHGSVVNALAFTPDGESLASTATDGVLRIWNVRSGSLQHALTISSRNARDLDFSADGLRVLVSSNDKPLQLWDLDAHEIVREFTADTPPSAATLSPDGMLVAAAYIDRTARIHDLRRPADQGPITLPHTSVLQDLAFDSTAKQLVTAGGDHALNVWDLDADPARVTQVLRGHKDMVVWCRFSASGEEIVSASSDGTLRLWATATGTEIGALHGPAKAFVRISADAALRTIATLSFSQSIRLWDTEAAHDDGAIHSGARNLVMAAAFSPDSRRFATGTNDGIVRIWDAESATLIAALHGHSDFVHALAFTPDGRRLVSGSFDHTLRIWNMRTGACEAVLSGHESDIFSVAVSPDGRIMASASQDATIRLWDLDNHETTAILRGHNGPVRCVAFSPNDGGRMLASAGADRTIRLWDVESAAPRGVLKGHAGPVNTVAFSPSGMLLASCSNDHTARLWDVESHALFGEPLAHADAISSLSFSPDGTRLATGAGDASIHLWDMPDEAWRDGGGGVGTSGGWGTEVAVLRGHKYSLICVAFSPDGSRLVSGSLDKFIRLWETSSLAFRIDARHVLSALAPSAAEAVDAALAANDNDPAAAAEAIDAGATLEPNLRRAALDELLRRGAEAGAKAAAVNNAP